MSGPLGGPRPFENDAYLSFIIPRSKPEPTELKIQKEVAEIRKYTADFLDIEIKELDNEYDLEVSQKLKSGVQISIEEMQVAADQIERVLDVEVESIWVKVE